MAVLSFPFLYMLRKNVLNFETKKFKKLLYLTYFLGFYVILKLNLQNLLYMRLGKGIKIFRKKKDKKREFCSEWYKNLSEDEKQKLVEYRRSYYIKLKK